MLVVIGDERRYHECRLDECRGATQLVLLRHFCVIFTHLNFVRQCFKAFFCHLQKRKIS